LELVGHARDSLRNREQTRFIPSLPNDLHPDLRSIPVAAFATDQRRDSQARMETPYPGAAADTK
jgi:hypothetical protein